MKTMILSICLGLSLAALSAPKAVIRADHADCLYRCGEKAVFTVSILDGEALVPTGTVGVVVDNYGPNRQLERKFDLAKGNPFVVSATMSVPGFARLQVLDAKGKGVSGGRYGAGFDVEKIRPTTPDPKDFDSYWSREKARLDREVPLDPTCTKDEKMSNGVRTIYRVSFATFGGKRVYGFLSVPVKPGKYPVRVHVPGYGPWTIFSECAPRDAIGLHMNVHLFEPPETQGEMNRLCKEADAARQAKTGCGYLPVSGMDVSREEYFYHDVMLGINRAVDWACARPDADPSSLTYRGMSQGGAFGLYLAYLNGRFTRLEVAVTALTDMFGFTVGRQSGWPQPMDSAKDPASRERRAAVAPYFDGVNFARRIKVPTMFVVGFADNTCAPHNVYAAYNVMPAREKRIFNAVGEGHMADTKPAAQKAVTAWFAGN